MKGVKWKGAQAIDEGYGVVMCQFDGRLIRARIQLTEERFRYAVEQLSSHVRKQRALELSREYSQLH